MNLTELLENLSAHNVELWVDGDKLRYRSPENVLTPELLSQIKQYKQEIIRILSQGTDRAPTYPLSHGQKALWFLHQLAPTSTAYNVTYAAKLVTNLDISALRQAAQALVERHPVLRTTFTTIDREPVQTVHKNQEVDFSIEEVFHWNQDDVNSWLSETSDRPFDLEQGPILRFNLLINHTTTDTLATKENILLITVHHIVGDFWSLEIMISELRTLYAAISTGVAAQLPLQNSQYRDYVNWSEQMLTSSEGERLWTYWQQQLSGELPLLNLPTDRPRPETQTYNGASHFFTFEEKLLQKLTELAKKEGVSVYTVILTTLQILLLRYTNQEDILIGSPMVNRSRSEFEKIVGYFTNPVVLRADLSGNPTFQELLERSRCCVLNALDHQDYPFPLLVERLKPLRDPSFSPLYQVALAWDRSHQGDQEVSIMDSDGLIVESMIPGAKGAAFDLTLTVLDVPGSLKGIWNYNTDLFDAATIERMTGHFLTLVEAIVANPQQPIAQLPILTASEQQQLLVEWNETQVDYPQDKCIHQLFEEQVGRTPDAVAVVYEEQQLTYRELNARANQLAHYLRSLGVGADVLVGICVERSVSMVVGLLAILKAGGAYVPLDPEYPQERLSFMLEDSGTSVLLTQSFLKHQLPLDKLEHPLQVLILDEETFTKELSDNLSFQTTPEHLAYVIYTSGSTGRPKGVMIEHRAIVNLSLTWAQTFAVQPQSRLLQFGSFSFDLSIGEIATALAAGACLYLGKKETVLPSQALVDFLAKYQISHAFLSPSALSVLPRASLSDLQCLTVGGEVCPAELVKQWGRGRRFYNCYGPTESTVIAAIALVQANGKKPPIGKPLSNIHIYILDANNQLVPIGIPGELHIGGAGLARGYLNRPELTLEKFIPNPFESAQASRLYKTGDLARYLPDGNIEYLGRIDNQVKIRGFRIELGEIEAALSQHPHVESTVVIARSDNPGDKRLVAYILPDKQVTPTIKELRQFLKTKLPEYMVPSAFVMLESLPLTPNGKVDRRALPKPEARTGIKIDIVLPRTPIEEKLAQIWAQVLRIDKIGIHDNFFQLGGDSILSIQIITRAKQAGIELTVKQLFVNQTIAELATVASTTKAPQIEQGLVTGTLPLTPVQQWFLEQELPQKHHFNQSFLLLVPSDLNLEILEQVWQQLLVHHDALRLRFSQTDLSWQLLHAAPTASNIISYFDLSTIPESEQKTAIETTANSLQGSLNLSENLVQVAFFWLGIDKKARLLIVIHHLVVDGVSWRILLEDLQTAYQQSSQGQAIKLPAKTTSFKDWAQKLREYAQSEVLKSELAYWLSASRASVASIPVDYSQGVNTAASATTVSVSLNKAQTQALLQDVPKAYKTQINDVLLTALVLVLARWTNSKSVLFNLEGHGREDIIDGVDLSRTVGWFTTIFPVALKVEAIDKDKIGNTLKSVKEQLRAIPNKGIGYGLLRYLNVDEEILAQLMTIPQAEISFNYLGQFTQVINTSSLMQVASESSGRTYSLEGQRHCLLDINAVIVNEQLQIDWTYSSNIHQQQTIENIAQEFVVKLQEIIAHCLSPENGGYTPTDFPFIKLNQLELDQLLASLALKPKLGKTNWQNIEDIYPLSPMQEGMLFESLYAPDTGVYFEQMICTLTGNLDVSAFEQAWIAVVEKHSIFRTAFVWESLSQALQIVSRQVEVKVEIYDWRELSALQQQAQLETFLDCERQQGFQLSVAPLMRLHLLRLDGNTYQFVWCSHHILLDGWSSPLVFKDLLEFYQAISRGETLALQPTSSYRNYIAWLQQQDRDLAGEFWREKLKGFSAPTPLTVDKPLSNREQHSGYREQQIYFTVSATTAVDCFARQHQLTLNNLVQATWGLLLSRYSQETDVVFGATVSGRTPEVVGVESIVGLFINTLPVRVQISQKTELLSLLKDLQAQQVESEQFSYSSLVEIQGLSDVPRGTSLFESIVVFENYPVDADVLQGNGSFSLSNLRGVEQTNYPLTVVAVPGEQLLLKVSYDTSRFESETISRMLGHFVTMLTGIVANPQQPIAQLPILTASEQQQLLVEWNDTQVDYPQDKCIHQLFEEQVGRTPDAVAVVYENSQLTYHELNCRANQLAHYLRSLGVGADVLVGICVERSLSMVVGMLGILKAGGAYVPLDPEYPTERLSFMLEDAAVSVLLTQQHLVEKLQEHQAQLVCLDSDRQLLTQLSQENFICEVQGNNLGYVIYTSGSTGQPKGVAMSQSALCNLILSQMHNGTISSGVKTLQFAPVSFDVSFQEMFSTWFSGGTLLLIPEELRQEPLALLGLLQQQAVARVFVPFVGLQQLAEVAVGNQLVTSHLREIITAGEQLQMTPAICNWLSQLSECTLHNHYGPSESHVVTTFTLSHSANSWSLLPPIGRPIANTQIYILDRFLQPVPIGIPGELHIGGAGLARGYLNRPELTLEKFIPNPFNNSKFKIQNSKLYKTGDLARYLPDGNIEYLGRIDNQVKIRGFRIELGEIEAALSQHPHVESTVVIARSDTPGDKRLVAYILPDKQVTPTIKELRQFLKTKLPEYMVPSAFVMLESLPLTPNGKVDRRALPKPEFDSTRLDKYLAPRTPIEEILALIWAQVLKVEQVGIYDNFFELGGHSLLATQLVSRIRNTLKVELPLRSLFAAATIAELAQSIQQLQQQNLQLTSPPILARAENVEIPLSFAQQRLWFLDQLETNSGFYNIPVSLRLQGQLQRGALEQSLIEIIARHQALRTNFITVDGQARQIIHTQTNWTVSVVELQNLGTNEIEIATEKLAQQQAIQPFDLASESLIRATLVVLSDTEHLLLVCMHHIVSDGWSMGVFVSELQALYNAYSQGQPSPLAPVTIQYADFAIWQRNWLVGDVLESQLAYWQQQLKDAPGLLVLPTDRPRPAVQTFTGAHQQFALSLEISQKLTKLSQEQGCTLFMTLLAAFDTLLYRYTGTEDILVGTPIANRDRHEIEGLIGFFVNTLVMRTDISGNPSFCELLTRVREMAMDAYAMQNLPFEMLVEVLQPERDLSHTPLFQVMFVLQNAPTEQLELSGLTVSSLPIESATAKFDLTLAMENTAGGLFGVWEYNTDLFDAATIERMTGHFLTLVEAIVLNPQQPIAQLPILTASEQQQLLVEWNDTQVDYPQDKCIHQLFEEQVGRTPDAVAVVYENSQLTYHELNCRANQLAHYLRSLGVGADVLVGICVERSLSMVVGLLAILKAGGAYVPLDPEYPTERLSFMLEDAAVSVLLTQQYLVERLPQHQSHIICLDTDWFGISKWGHDNPINHVQPENLAYVIYTSGSTGQPKGAMILHQGVVNYLSWCIQAYAVADGDGAPVQSSFAFDATITSFFSPLIVGKQVILLPKQQEIEALCVVLQSRRQFSLVKLTPAHLELLNQLLPSLEAAAQTKALVIGGEPLFGKTLHFWQQNAPNTRLINEYGPTETVVGCSFYEVRNETSLAQGILIGRPIANTQIYILDSNLKPVPIGIPGELHIGGAGLARGYLNRPELTLEKFIPNPFNNSKFKIQNSKLYKTGDLARYLPDGNIEYLGRIDNQVKIRGFRIELGEIEAALSQHPHVESTVVIARSDNPGDKRLVAYIVANKQVTPTIKELRQFLKTKLPEYMVPSAFVLLESLPLTPNGKVDRRALPKPEFDSTRLDKYLAPRTPVEEILALIWAQVLKVEQVGIYDNFFELGGHSLLATQLVSRIRNTLKVELPLRSLFAAATIAELAQSIQQLQQQNLQLTSPPILARAENAEIPLSFAQQRLWFLDQLETNSGFYNIPVSLRLQGQLQRGALEQSLIEIIARHQALRTNFITVDGQARQIIHTQTNWTVSVVELQNLGTNEIEIATEKLAQQQAIQPFDLASESLIRATLVVLSDTEHLLLVCMHHIVSDGWSMGVFVSELQALYNAYSQGQPSPLAPVTIQYADFAIWQRNWLVGDVLESQLAYWQQQLKDAPGLLVLPTDRPRPAVQTFTGAHQQFALSLEISQKLTKLSQEQGCTLFMTLLAAFDTLLYRYTGTEDILVGTPIANRDRHEIEGLIGFFVNTLVMRTDISGNPSFCELLTRVREMAMDAYAMQNLPFEMLVEVLQPERDLSHTPLFQVMFVLQNAPTEQLELSGLTVSSLPIESATAKFDLTLAMENTAGGLFGVWEYNTDLFDAATIERMTGHFLTLVEAIVLNPQQPIAQLPILTASEQQQLLVEWNDTQVDYPQDKCIHQLFEEQVGRTPDAVAVVYENSQLTYHELNCRANQLAHYLRSLGVGADVLVGICVERSLSMVVGLLAILKAGGAYVPLDPEYPTERLSFMLEDAAVSVLLTQQYLVERLPQHQSHIICLDTDWFGISKWGHDNPINHVQPENLAYVIYTSGSTGQPKGAMILHQGVVNYLSWCIQAYAVADGDGAPVQSSFAFDATITSFFSPLIVGKQVILLPKQQEIEALCVVLQSRRQFSLVKLTPAHLELLNQLLPSLEAAAQTKALVIGGEPLFGKTLHFWQQNAPNTRLINEYGPTETVVGCSFYEVRNETSLAQGILIGRPIANTQIYILDSNLKPVPIGIPGELHIGGAGLARGYLNRPELTLEKFIPNPFNNSKFKIQNSKLYKTGDLARYLPDGNIEYLGRIDNQVKIRGFRIELGEIEAALSQHPHVESTVVIARSDNPGDKRLVAYIVANKQVTPTIKELRQFLKTKLPEYMVPSAFVLLESLPLTPNGKVDRRALPKPEFDSSSHSFVSPRNTIELQLAQIWSKILKLDNVGVKDNFFDLGGHSLLVPYLIAQIKQQFGKDIPLATLFQNPTIEQLITVVQKDADVSSWSPLVALQPNGFNPPLFCLPGAGGNPFYLYNLARCLAPDQPFYTFQAHHPDRELPSITSVEETAAQYIQAMQVVQPQGPYFLAGHSFGGKVVYEMAQQLIRQGQDVALLGILDTTAPNHQPKQDELDDTQWLINIAKVLTIAAAKDFEMDTEGLSSLAADEQLQYVLQFLKMVEILPDNAETRDLNRLLQAFKADSNAEYVPQQVHHLPITLFRATESDLEASDVAQSEILQDSAWGWTAFSSEAVDIHFVPGSHVTMIAQPHVQVLAQCLKACIDKARATIYSKPR